MPEQLALPGFEAAPQPTDRLFFALLPDADTAARIAQLARRLRDAHGLKGRPLAVARLHVSLYHLGDHAGLPQNIVAAADEAASAVAMPPFAIAFDRAASFMGKPRNRPFVLRECEGLDALMALHGALGMTMRKAGLGRWVSQHYTPHVTLLYDNRVVAEQAIEPIGWTLRDFVLVHSVLGRSRHTVLARWTLRG